MGKSIYILEDDQGIREIMELILADEGFDVHAFASVSEFRFASAEPLPDLYLLDVMLPDGNGLEVCTELKTQQRTQHIPVLIMSAHIAVEQMQQHSGAQGHIAKPFDVYLLIDQIKDLLK